MAAGKKMKFHGSSFQVQSAIGVGKAITDIDNTDPALVTSAAHGFALGAPVKITGVEGMEEVNDSIFVVDNPDTNDFELAGVDGTGYGVFVLDSPNDAKAFPLTLSPMCELTGLNQQDGASDDVDFTSICSTAKEFESGLGDSGQLTLDFNFAPNTAIQTALRTAKRNGDQLAFKVTFPGTGGSVVMVGSVKQTSFQGSVGDNKWTGSATIRLSGEIFVLAA
jgi:hypothetical protein